MPDPNLTINVGSATVTSAELASVFQMPPEKAIAFFEAKGLRITWDWKESWRHAHAQSFTVANVTRLDVLSDIQRALAEDLRNGGSFQSFLEKLQPQLEAKGWWGKREQTNRHTGEIRTVTYGTPWRLETIYETNMQSAYMAGRHHGMKAGAELMPWWEYAAVMDNRTRPTHAAMNGLVFRHDDPIWSVWYPPNGFRCRCRVIPRSDIAQKRGDFEVSSGSGRMETATQSVRRRDGKIEEVPIQGYRDPITKKLITPEMGFDNNPAAARERLDKLYNEKLQTMLKVGDLQRSIDFEKSQAELPNRTKK